jgi:leader peptidase (prepilin peptidase)/N-methyltransferase
MELNLLFAAVLGMLGLPVGSLLNMAAIRVLKKQSVAFPPSHCIHCQHPLRLRDLFPVISFLSLRGTCRYCKKRISPVYPIGEMVTAILFMWTGWHYGPLNSEWVAALFLCSMLIVITHTDLKAMLIPNAVVIPGVAMAFVLRVFLHPLPWWNYAAAAAVGFGVLYLLAVVSKGGMGGGDIKLYLFIGLIGGLSVTLLSLFIASLLGMIYALLARVTGRQRGKEQIPFGPFIAVGAFLAFLYGDAWMESVFPIVEFIIPWYYHQVFSHWHTTLN